MQTELISNEWLACMLHFGHLGAFFVNVIKLEWGSY